MGQLGRSVTKRHGLGRSMAKAKRQKMKEWQVLSFRGDHRVISMEETSATSRYSAVKPTHTLRASGVVFAAFEAKYTRDNTLSNSN